jgi:hypothetical protein
MMFLPVSLLVLQCSRAAGDHTVLNLLESIIGELAYLLEQLIALDAINRMLVNPLDYIIGCVPKGNCKLISQLAQHTRNGAKSEIETSTQTQRLNC